MERNMKNVGLGFLLMGLLAACSQQGSPNGTELTAQAGSWQKLGGALDFTVEKDATEPRLLFDRSGNLVAAWAENNNGWRVYLERWTGTTWQSFGGTTPPASSSSYFSIVFDNTDAPIISNYSNPARNGVGVYRRDPVTKIWKQLGISFSGPANIAADKNGAVYSILHSNLSFQGELPLGKNLVRRWNGSSWQTLYTFQKRLNNVDIPLDSLSFKSDGKPAVFWTYPDSSFTQEISFWNGTSWDDVFSLSLGLNSGALGLDKKDQRLGFRTFSNGDGTSAVFPFQADNGLTPDVNNPLTTTAFPTLTVDNLNRPIITLGVKGTDTNNNDLIIKRWNGSRWVSLGGVVDRVASRDVGGFGVAAAVVVDRQGVVYAVWKECVGTISPSTGCSNNNIYVSKFVP
jgi:hypothetical protein